MTWKTEEIETGVETGCNPSPWAPCVPTTSTTNATLTTQAGGYYRREYTIKRTYTPTYNNSDCQCGKA